MIKKTDKQKIIKATMAFARKTLEGASAGHDWWHVVRVYENALLIAKSEKSDLFVVSLAALLHDIADHKFHGGDEEIGPKVATKWLSGQGVEGACIDHVCDIVRHISFKGAKVATPMRSIEGKIVQDADRLESMGATGIARTFAYSGYKGRPIFDPSIKVVMHRSFAHYKSSRAPAINHFYEKLLLLKDLMNTKAGKKLAAKRHKFMLHFLDAFFEECGMSKRPHLKA